MSFAKLLLFFDQFYQMQIVKMWLIYSTYSIRMI